jgi:(p)ppGpp synthase/HD superfamily hydrolase
MNEIVNSAKELVEIEHEGQFFKGDPTVPFINHLSEVVNLLIEVGGIDDSTIITAGYLHDILEKTTLTDVELKKLFGEKITGIVKELTIDPNLSKDKARLLQINTSNQLSSEAKVIRLCDKISNIKMIAESKNLNWTYEEKYDYFSWAEDVVTKLKGTNDSLECYFFDEHRWGRLRF